MTSLDDLRMALQNLDESMVDGVRASELARLLGVGLPGQIVLILA